MIRLILSSVLALLNIGLLLGAGPTAPKAPKGSNTAISGVVKPGNKAGVVKPKASLPIVGDADDAGANNLVLPSLPRLVDIDPNAPIEPRQPHVKRAITGPNSIMASISPNVQRTGRVIFKFRDELKGRTGMKSGRELFRQTAVGIEPLAARMALGDRLSKGELEMVNDLTEVQLVLTNFNATVKQLVQIPPAELAAMETKAELIGRRKQADLAGILAATPAKGQSSEVLAEALNNLPGVEYAMIEVIPEPTQDAQCQRDVALQSGIASAGNDLVNGLGCSSFTNAAGATMDCFSPPPIFLRPDNTPLAAPAGVIPCHAPNRWAGFQNGVATASGCSTAAPTYTPLPSPSVGLGAPLTWDCTPNCNYGGGGGGQCIDPPTSQGWQSVPNCQYGCQDRTCAEYVKSLGFTQCTTETDLRGWDALCATIANIYCGGLYSSNATPYTSSVATGLGSGVGGTGFIPDMMSAVCWHTNSISANAGTALAYGFGSIALSTGDVSSYDPCFVMRGPAQPPEIDSALGLGSFVTNGVLVYTDVGNGTGISPWGFDAPGSQIGTPTVYPINNAGAAPATYPALAPGSVAFVNAYTVPYALFTTPLPISATFPTTAPGVTCNFTGAGAVGGIWMWNTNTMLLRNAQYAVFNQSLKGFPFAFSHDCLSVDDVVPGCYQSGCCAYVCIADPSCCMVGWDASCVSAANSEIDNPAGAPIDPDTNPETLPSPNASRFSLCGGQSLSTTSFPTAIASPTPPFRDSYEATEPTNFRVRGMQIWNYGSPVVASCSEYTTIVNAESPPPGPGQVQLSTLTPVGGANPIDETMAFVNTGFGGGGIPVEGMIEFITESFPSVNPNVLRGAGRTIGVIDNSAFIDHESIVGRVAVEPGQTIVVTPLGSDTQIDPDHGTAILSILIGQPVVNSDSSIGGISGLVTQADTLFLPAISVEEGGRIATAIARAGQLLISGDVLCIPLGLTGNYSSNSAVCLTAIPYISDQLSIVQGLGITTVVSAGNGGFQSTLTSGGTDTFSVVVGSCWPGNQIALPIGAAGSLACSPPNYPGISYCRYRTSNWTSSQGPAFGGSSPGIDVAGWGTGMCTAGVGTLWRGDNVASTSSDYSNPALTTNRLRTYQSSFSGTSAAAAMITGLVCAMQGTAESILGSEVSPSRIRNILANKENLDGTTVVLDTVTLQCGGNPGTALPTTVNDNAITVNNGDLAPSGAGSIHQVGGFPIATRCLEEVLDTQFYEGGIPFTTTVIRGLVRAGNSFSAAVYDNGFLQISGATTSRGSTGAGYGAPFPYMFSGRCVDVQIRATTQFTDPDDFTDMGITLYGKSNNATATSGSVGNPLVMIYAFNNQSRRWVYLDADFLTSINPTLGSSSLVGTLGATGYSPMNFLITEGTEQVMYFRVITYGFGVKGNFQAWWDWFDINPNVLSGPG